jgi:photosystem II stability/assembly factor-like uncharacterized protein
MQIVKHVLVTVALILLAVGTLTAQWTKVGGIPATDVPSLLVRDNVMYAGTDSAVYISTDGGGTWTRSATLPGSPWFIDALTVFDGKIFAGTGGNGVFVSSNNGLSWIALSAGLSGAGSHHITSFAERNGVLYAGTGGAGVFRLQGTTWLPFGSLAANLSGNVWFVRAKGDTLVAGAGGNGFIWYAPSGATDWTGVLVAPLQGFEMLVTSMVEFRGALVVGSTYGIFRSTDNGASWLPMPSGIPGARPVALTVAADTLVAAAQSAATRFYRSADGILWTYVEQTIFSNAQVLHNNKLYAARLDGLWYKTIPSTGVEEPELPGRIALEQNYPNPFNPSTNIRFRVQGSGIVSLKVFDMLGREVATLVNEERPADFYTVSFNASGLASGVYLYRLTAGGMSLTRRMVVVR